MLKNNTTYILKGATNYNAHLSSEFVATSVDSDIIIGTHKGETEPKEYSEKSFNNEWTIINEICNENQVSEEKVEEVTNEVIGDGVYETSSEPIFETESKTTELETKKPTTKPKKK